MKSIVAIALFNWAIAGTAFAQQRLEDISPVQQVRAELEWAVPIYAMGKADHALGRMLAYARHVEIRLDTSDYLGRRVRIYLRLPLRVSGIDGAAALRLSWLAGGVFQDGAVVPGERVLVFAGTVREPILRDILNFQVQLDAGAVKGQIRLDPVFEIETL